MLPPPGYSLFFFFQETRIEPLGRSYDLKGAMRGRGSTLLPLLRTLTSRQGHAEAAVATRASSVSLTTTSESTSDSAGQEVGKGPLRGFALPQFWESRAQRQAHRSLNSASALEVCPHIFISPPTPSHSTLSRRSDGELPPRVALTRLATFYLSFAGPVLERAGALR